MRVQLSVSAAYSVLRTQNDEEKQAATVDCSQRPHRCCRLTTKVENVDRELSLRTIGADLHRTTVATAPGEKLITGRRPVRNWTRRTISSLFLCRKLHLLLGKSTKTAANDLQFSGYNMRQIVCRPWRCPDPMHYGELTSLRQIP